MTGAAATPSNRGKLVLALLSVCVLVVLTVLRQSGESVPAPKPTLAPVGLGGRTRARPSGTAQHMRGSTSPGLGSDSTNGGEQTSQLSAQVGVNSGGGGDGGTDTDEDGDSGVNSAVAPVVDPLVDTTTPHGFRILATGVADPPAQRAAGGWRVEPPPLANKFDFERASYIPYPKAKLVFMTAASQNHVRVASCLIQSIRRQHPNPETHPVIFYDLGIEPEGVPRLERLGVEVRKFEFSKYPEWWDVNVNAGEYAWKPEIYFEVLRESLAPVFWFDSGNLLKRELDSTVPFLRKYGMFIIHAAGKRPMAAFNHPESIQFFTDLDEDHPIRQGSPPYKHDDEARMAATGFFAFDPFHERARTIAYAWKLCAHVRQCIAPVGSTKAAGLPESHRQDQSAMAMLVDWKFKDTWKYKKQFGKKPVRIHMDKKRCKHGENGFTFVAPKYGS